MEVMGRRRKKRVTKGMHKRDFVRDVVFSMVRGVGMDIFFGSCSNPTLLVRSAFNSHHGQPLSLWYDVETVIGRISASGP